MYKNFLKEKNELKVLHTVILLKRETLEYVCYFIQNKNLIKMKCHPKFRRNPKKCTFKNEKETKKGKIITISRPVS